MILCEYLNADLCQVWQLGNKRQQPLQRTTGDLNSSHFGVVRTKRKEEVR